MKLLNKLSDKVKRIVHDEWVEIKSCDIFNHHEEEDNKEQVYEEEDKNTENKKEEE